MNLLVLCALFVISSIGIGFSQTEAGELGQSVTTEGADGGVPAAPTFEAPELPPEAEVDAPPDTFDPELPYLEEDVAAEPVLDQPSTLEAGGLSELGGQSLSISEPEDVTVNESTLYADLATPHGIQSDGAYRYSYPIEVPRFRGLEPRLSLDYASLRWSHEDVDNVMGSGWRISGFSKIERRAVNGGLAPHDITGGVFYLDGEALLACDDAAANNRFGYEYPGEYKSTHPSASCSNGGNFVTEHETYARILFQGGRGVPSSKFIVWRPDGTRLTYETLSAIAGVSLGEEPVGTTLEAKVAAAKWENRRNILAANTWLLTEVRDTHQGAGANVVLYDYAVDTDRDSFDYRPSSISYGGYEVSLAYERSATNPVSTYPIGFSRTVYNTYLDSDGDYRTESAVVNYPRGEQEWRLHSIYVNFYSNSIRAYRTSHSYSDAGSGSHRLNFIGEFGKDRETAGGLLTGGGTGLPSPHFSPGLS